MAQAKMKTPAQLRRIYALARERGLDDEMLHAYVCQLTGRESLKDLTMKEAARVIDALGPSGGFTAGGITPRQWKYMLGLAKELGWTDREGNADTKKLDEFALRNYKKYAVRWLTVRKRSWRRTRMRAKRPGRLETAFRRCWTRGDAAWAGMKKSV